MALQFSRHYTPNEARRILPTVRGWLAELDELYSKIRGAETSLQPRLESGEDLGGEPVVGWVRNLGEVHSVLREFQSREIQLKDAARGLVDFPAVLDGREVFLCWERSEDGITHWHAIGEGYAGRQPLWDSRDRQEY